MSDRPAPNLSESELRHIHAETGVDVFALRDLMKLTPTERLRIAMANANNLKRLRDATRRIPRTR